MIKAKKAKVVFDSYFNDKNKDILVFISDFLNKFKSLVRDYFIISRQNFATNFYTFTHICNIYVYIYF